jgi:PGF-CTERM protein
MDMEGTCSESDLKSSIIRCVVVLFISMALVFAIPTVVAEDGEVEVKVNAPEYVEEKATFDVTIDVDGITDFNAGQFDLSFDPSVVKVEDVTDGSIDETTIPVEMWMFMESDTIRVMLMLPEDEGVSGSGYLAKITFKVKGDEGDVCALEIDEAESFLGNITADEIPVKEWIGAEIKVGVEEEEEEEPTPTPTLAPGETPAPTPETNVTETPTSTPTPTLVPGVTPSPTPTLAPGETAKPVASPGTEEKPKPTPKPTAPPGTEEKPTPTPTPKPAIPGFEAVIAIVGLVAIAYILRRKRE